MKLQQILLVVAIFLVSCNAQNDAQHETADTTAAKIDTRRAVSAQLPFDPDVPGADVQIKMALLAAPPEKRDSATVYGYNAAGKLVVLRKGSNELICVADEPGDSSLSVVCYYKDLEPLMERGRELRQQGVRGQQLDDERAKEVKEGTLKMPDGPSTLYVYSANEKDVNRTTGDIKNGALRYVIYTPFATAASTGLPTKPSAPGMPWIMDPGTYKSHIMINP